MHIPYGIGDLCTLLLAVLVGGQVAVVPDECSRPPLDLIGGDAEKRRVFQDACEDVCGIVGGDVGCEDTARAVARDGIRPTDHLPCE